MTVSIFYRIKRFIFHSDSHFTIGNAIRTGLNNKALYCATDSKSRGKVHPQTCHMSKHTQGSARRMTSLCFKPITMHPLSTARPRLAAGRKWRVSCQGATNVFHNGMEWAGGYNWESVPRSRIIIFWSFIFFLPKYFTVVPSLSATAGGWLAFGAIALAGKEGWQGGKETVWDREGPWAWRIRAQVSSSGVLPLCQSFTRAYIIYGLSSIIITLSHIIKLSLSEVS